MDLLNQIGEVAARTLLQLEKVDDETKSFRFSVCVECDKRDVEANRCKVCKCYLAVKTGTKENINPKKGRREITHCPLGKWGDLAIANEYRKIDGLPLLQQ